MCFDHVTNAEASEVGTVQAEVVLRQQIDTPFTGPIDCATAAEGRTVEVVEQLAATDGSTAWAAAIGFGTNHFAGYLPPDGAAEVFADPDQSNASMFAPLAEVTEGPRRHSAPHRALAVHQQLPTGGLARPGRPLPGRTRPPPGVRA